MKYYIALTLLLIIIPMSLFGNHPRYRDDFLVENKTGNDIVIVLENIGTGDSSVLYSIKDKDDLIFMYGSSYDPQKYFRTISPGEFYRIGYSMYDDPELDKMSAVEKFSSLFNVILIFDTEGDLLFRIDEFNENNVCDRTSSDLGVYFLIIEGGS